MEMITCLVHYIATICNIISPVMIFIATFLWIRLYMITRKQADRFYMRSYALEQQIDYLVNNRHDFDHKYFTYMKKTFEDIGDRLRG